MRKALLVLGVIAMLVGAVALPAFARGQGNPNAQPVVYVESQGLAYDSIVTADPLPFVEGAPFQELKMGGPTGLYTEYGPGDQGYVGGRWWVDVNDNGIMDEGDHFFMCPLLGPGFDPH